MVVKGKMTIGKAIELHMIELKERGYTVINFNHKDMLDFMTKRVVQGLEKEGYKCIVKANNSRSNYVRLRRY